MSWAKLATPGSRRRSHKVRNPRIHARAFERIARENRRTRWQIIVDLGLGGER
jgi:hypothetical protein